MWKKAFVICLAWIGTFSVAYAMNQEMMANSGYHAGGNVTGRVNMIPNGMSGNHFGIQKGDKVMMGVTNPYTSKPLAWQLLNYHTYTDYGCTTTSSCNGAEISNWQSMSTEPIAKMPFVSSSSAFQNFGKPWKTVSFKDSKVYPILQNLNTSIGNSQKDKAMVAPRNLEYAHDFYNSAVNAVKPDYTQHFIFMLQHSTFDVPEFMGESAFILDNWETLGKLYDGWSGLTVGKNYNLENKDLTFSENYITSTTYHDIHVGGASEYFLHYYLGENGNQGGPVEENAIKQNYAVRPSIYLNLSNTVFGLSLGKDDNPAVVHEPILNPNYTSIYDSTKENENNGENLPMKLRVENAALTNSTLFHGIKNYNGNTISIAPTNTKLTIDASATAGDDGNGGVNTVSILMFDENDKFVYYQPLESAKGVGNYEFDTSGIQAGKYKIGIVNEVYNENSTAPADSSAITDVLPLEIVDALSDLTFTSTPSLEYSKNVKSGDTVGVISSKNGIGIPIYKVVADSSYPNDINHFELDTDGKTVKIKGDALEAGTYHFKIQAQDGNKEPSIPLEIPASISVAKTSPDLKFTTNSIVHKVVGDTAFTESFTHKNTDTSDALFKLTYSSTATNVATVDTPSSNTDTDIEITPGSMNGSTVIEVELAATKNFTADSATLTVNVHPKISLVFTADKNSFAVSEVVNAGTKIGSVSLTGNSPQYEYTMAVDPIDTDAGANNALFDIRTTGKTNATSMDIITKSPNIPQGTYKIMIKAEDAYGQIAYAKGTIKIAGMAQTGFDFYDYRNVSTKLTNETLTIYYGETEAKLFAKGGQSSGLTYAPDNPTQTVLTINPSDGTLVTNDIGKVKVKATKPADGTYSEAVIYMFVEVEPCEQEINFDKTGNTTISYDNTNGHTFTETATGKIKTGMPNAGDTGHGTITYSLGGTDKGIASISPTGEITINAGQNISTMKTFTVTAKLNDGNTKNPKYGSDSATKTVNVYPPGSASWTQTNKPQAENNTGTEKLGDLTVTGGSGNASFAISTSGDADNLDKEFFDVDPTSGEVTLIKQIAVADIASKTYNQSEKAYEMHVMVDITDGGNTTTEHLTIYIKGAERSNLDFKNRDTITQEITETYDANKSFNLTLNQSIQGTSYRISTNPSHTSPNDVITVSANGKADIQNANEVSISGSTTAPVYVEAVVPPSAGYQEMIIEAPVRIKRASQTLVFSQNPINTSADIQSLTITMSGHKDGNNLVYSSSDSKVKALADPTNSDVFTIKPNGVVKNGITITAIAQGDRNYKDDLKTATLNIAQAGTNQFTAIFPSMTYGDAGPFQVTIAPAGSGNETYTYTVADTNIVEIDANGNITPHHAGSTTVDVTQTSAGGTVGPYTFTITVDPKPITVTIEDKAKYTGMAMPAFTVDIPSADIVAGDTIPIPEFRCVDTNGFDVDASTGAGSYPITGTYPNPPSDYDITLVEGKLAVSQDNGSQSWYELQDKSGNKTSSSVWHKNSVDIVLKPATGSAGTYDQIANDTIFSNQSLTKFTVTEEGETTQDIYFRIDPNGSDPNKGAITLPIQETIRIDNTDPVITSIVGKNAPNSKLRALLNTLTFGKYFKQGMVITIHAEDVEPQPGVVVSGIQKITYTINKVDAQGNPIGTPNTVNQSDETVEVSIQEAGNYKVCAKATDQAGNEGSNTCEEFDIRKIDVDVDKDGKPDFNDPDGDGCADFNIVYKDEETGNWKTLNVDANRDGIPEMNVDTDGDGKPDINVDSDDDGKPDLNLVLMTKELWKPTQCVIQHGEQYDSVMRIDPQINVVIDNGKEDIKNQIPSINIDNNGDMEPDLNISKDGKKPYLNIVKLHEWKPVKDYSYAGFNYDSIGVDGIKIELNRDTDGDGSPDINLDANGDGTPDLNIDTNYDGIPDLNIDANGNGKPDFNIDVSGNGFAEENIYKITEWKPNKDKCNIDGFEYDTMEIISKSEIEDNGIIIEKPDGSFLPNTLIKVNEISDSIDEKTKEQLDKVAKDQEVKKVYDVEYLENDTAKQPDGKVNVKIPVEPLIKNAKVVIEKEDGSFEEVSYTEKDGYYVFETEYIGKVSVIGDVEEEPDPKPTPDPEPTPKPDPEPTTTPDPEQKNPNTSVQGNYTTQGGTITSGMGGAYTGDETNVIYYIVFVGISLGMLFFMTCRKRNKE